MNSKLLVSIAVCAFSTVIHVNAQSGPDERGQPQDAQVRGYWSDPSTGLMWAEKDNGRDVSGKTALKYCRNLRLAGFSDWSLPTIDELEGIFDKSAPRHVKGNILLTGNPWSSTRLPDDRGHPSGYSWYFNFNGGHRIEDPFGYDAGKRALCVRQSGT